MWLLSIALAAAAGWLWTRRLLAPANLEPRWARHLLAATLGAGLGAGATSCLYFLLVASHAAWIPVLLATDVLLCLSSISIPSSTGIPACVSVRDTGMNACATNRFRWNPILLLALFAALALFLVSFAEASRSNPQGEWDAWSLWNLRAKYLTSGDTWRYAASPLLEHTHPEYPLLLSGFIARSWRYSSGDCTAAAPIATALFFSLAVIGVLIAAVAILRSTSAGLLAGLILLANSPFLSQAPSQYADMPLTFYMLGALVLAVLALRSGSSARILATAGCFAAFAAWTKNEGLVVAVAISICLFAAVWRYRGARTAARACVSLLLGAAPVLLLVLWFKLRIAPVTDALLGQPLSQLLRQFTDLARWTQIGGAVFQTLLVFGGPFTHPFVLLAILAVALRFRLPAEERPQASLAGLFVILIAVADFLAYLLAASDLKRLFNTSLARVLIQPWPAFVFTAFLLLRPPEDSAIVDPAARRKRSKA